MICTTLNKIRNRYPCEDGWKKLLNHLGKTKADDEPLPMVTILDSNGLDDCLWCLRTLPEYDREWRLFAVWCARQVQHLMTDARSIAALDVAERFAHGQAMSEELYAARAAALDAARAAARAAERAAERAAARAAAWAAAWDAERDAALDATWAAARAAEWDAERDAQAKELRRILEE